MSTTKTRKKPVIAEVATLVAKLCPDEPAKVRRQHTTADVLAKMSRHNITREPDVLDEVTGEAAWMHHDIVVVVPVERLNDFRCWVSCHGMVRTDSYRVVRIWGARDWSWQDVFEAVKA